MMTVRSVALFAAVGALALGGSAALGASTTPAPTKLANPTKTCEQLNARFQAGLAPGQNAKLARFLSPAFIIERSDGSGSSWPGYIQDHAIFTDWSTQVVRAQFSTPVITCLASSATTQQATNAPAVRVAFKSLTTYVWQRGRWHITSFARFNQ